VQLADALARIVPKPLKKSLFVNTGSESNEAAIKMAKLHTGGFEVMGLGGSWHGVTSSASPCHSRAIAKAMDPACRDVHPAGAQRLSLSDQALSRQV